MGIKEIVYITAVLISIEGFAKESGSKVSSEVEVNSADKKLREPEEEDLELIRKNYGVSKSSLNEVTYSNDCDGDIPKEGPEKAVRANIAEVVNTKDLLIPKEAYVSFCNGIIRSITARQGSEIKVWGQSCGTYVEPDDHPFSFEKVSYRCGQSKAVKMDGVSLPSTVSIYFDKKGIRCFSLNEGVPPEKILGVGLKLYRAYHVKDGKIAEGCLR